VRGLVAHSLFSVWKFLRSKKTGTACRAPTRLFLKRTFLRVTNTFEIHRVRLRLRTVFAVRTADEILKSKNLVAGQTKENEFGLWLWIFLRFRSKRF
jgi:hypothetical protein